jgi:hypothetical protein
MNTKKNSQIIGNVGLYYVCYHLSRLGWNAMPTSRNAKGIDVVAYDSGCKKMITFQVKTLSKRSPVPLGTSIEKLMGDFWVIVNNIISEPTIYVMKPNEVKKNAHRGVKGDRVSFWLQPKSYEVEEYKNAWDRIGKP